MTRSNANFYFRIVALIGMCFCLYWNQRIDAALVGLLALLATTRYD
jgi:hypothetical protein